MPFSAFRFSSGPSRLATLFALLLAALLLAAPVRAQEPAVVPLGALKARAAASTASEALAANPKLVQQAARKTQQDDERILAEVTARLSRNVTFRAITPAAGRRGHAARQRARQRGAPARHQGGGRCRRRGGGREPARPTDFGACLHETWELLKDRAARAVAAIPLLITAIVVVRCCSSRAP